MSFFENTRKPVGFGGKIMVAMMNLGHSPVARWGDVYKRQELSLAYQQHQTYQSLLRKGAHLL